MWQPVNYVIDADIKGLFDNVNHSALRKCIEERITGKKFARYIMRFLKSGIVEEGKFIKTEIGTPQWGESGQHAKYAIKNTTLILSQPKMSFL